jgi:hypothetical protein
MTELLADIFIVGSALRSIRAPTDHAPLEEN